MPEGDGVIYNGFKEYVMKGIFNLASGGDTIQQSLVTSYSPDIDTHDEWGDAGVSSTEYGTGSGYTSGGATVSGQSVTRDTGGDQGVYDASTDVTWSSLGPLTPNTPSHTIQWDTTPAATPTDPLICYWLLGTTPTNGGDYTLQFGATGIILLT